MKTLFAVVALSLFTVPTCAADFKQLENQIGQIRSEQRDNKADIEQLENGIKETRRDQLNYKVEKDLLKEAYGSSLTTINTVLALGLGVITLIGFLGFRDIGTLKKEYTEELENLRRMRSAFAKKATSLSEMQKKIELELVRVTETNQMQSNRIKVLELQEKCAQLIASRNYIRALEYATVGLSLSPDEPILLDQKAISLFRIGRFEESLREYESLSRIDPKDSGVLPSRYELLLLLGKIEAFDKLWEENSGIPSERPGAGSLRKYFLIFRSFVAGDYAAMNSAIDAFVSPRTPPKRLEYWNFSEVETLVRKSSAPEEAKTKFLSFINVLRNTGGE